jgi:hypothetical protein
MASYFLREHIYFCSTEDGLVFLDQRRNRYTGLGPEYTSLITALASATCHSNDSKTLADSLVGKCFLTTSECDGKPLAPILHLGAQAVLVDADQVDLPRIRLHHILNMAASYALALWCLNCMPLHRIAMRIENRRKSRTVSATANSNLSRELVLIFQRVSPFFYGSQEHCLFDSLALVEFLARYEQYPTWVFGVRTRPFRAHCWVESDSLLFNDILERTRGFTPIMTI